MNGGGGKSGGDESASSSIPTPPLPPPPPSTKILEVLCLFSRQLGKEEERVGRRAEGK